MNDISVGDWVEINIGANRSKYPNIRSTYNGRRGIVSYPLGEEDGIMTWWIKLDGKGNNDYNVFYEDELVHLTPSGAIVQPIEEMEEDEGWDTL